MLAFAPDARQGRGMAQRRSFRVVDVMLLGKERIEALEHRRGMAS
jgi:hypothetical protein